jgi:hypothetical protein
MKYRIKLLPHPDSKDERLDNIYSATIKPIVIPMLQIPVNGIDNHTL